MDWPIKIFLGIVLFLFAGAVIAFLYSMYKMLTMRDFTDIEEQKRRGY